MVVNGFSPSKAIKLHGLRRIKMDVKSGEGGVLQIKSGCPRGAGAWCKKAADLPPLSGFTFPLTQILYQHLQVGDLLRRQAGYIQHLQRLPAQQMVRRDTEQVRDLFQKLNGGLDIVALPVGDTLLGNAQPVGQFDLCDPAGCAQAADLFVQHGDTLLETDITIQL